MNLGLDSSKIGVALLLIDGVSEDSCSYNDGLLRALLVCLSSFKKVMSYAEETVQLNLVN